MAECDCEINVFFCCCFFFFFFGNVSLHTTAAAKDLFIPKIEYHRLNDPKYKDKFLFGIFFSKYSFGSHFSSSNEMRSRRFYSFRRYLYVRIWRSIFHNFLEISLKSCVFMVFFFLSRHLMWFAAFKHINQRKKSMKYTPLVWSNTRKYTDGTYVHAVN